MSSSLVITSDPQYPWYDTYDDNTYGYPPGIAKADQPANSLAQIRGQYASINQLSGQRKVAGVIVNGDLTATGADDELPKWKDAVKTLTPDMFPALGNHDYQDYVDDTFNNNRASRMVDYMWGWLQNNRARLRSVDFEERDGSVLPVGSGGKTYTGSLAYSFNLGPVHLAMLQHFPFYQRSWKSHTPLGGSLNYEITPSFEWLKADLERARRHGDAILVFTHAYNDNCFPPGPQLDQFNTLMHQYRVSAVFAGHLHWLVGQTETIPPADTIQPAGIPLFRSGAASQQDYLVADLAFEPPVMTVSVYDGKTTPPSADKTTYRASGKPAQVPLVMAGPRVIVGGRCQEGTQFSTDWHDDPFLTWGVKPNPATEVDLGGAYGWNQLLNGGHGDKGFLHLYADWMAPDDVPDGTLTVTGGLVRHGATVVSSWGQPGTKQQLAAKLFTYVDKQVGDDYVDLYWELAPWGEAGYQPAILSGGEQQRLVSDSTRHVDVAYQWGYIAASAKPVLLAQARTYIDARYSKPMAWFTLFPV